MKQINNIYKDICNLDNIIKYTNIVLRNIHNKKKKEIYDEYISENIVNIYNILKSKNYIPNKYNIFLIKDPKYRIVMSQNLNDKIINHLVSKYILVNNFDKMLIDTCVATRVNRGLYLGIDLVKKYINKMKIYNKKIYFLKFDIKKYFYNMDHKIIKKLISNKIKDNNALDILFNIIDSTDSEYVNREIKNIKEREIEKINKLNISNKEKNLKINEINNIPLYLNGKGLPIGNMTSQVLSCIYLNELDHYIKEVLKIKYYIRYMDDGILFSNDIYYLKTCLNNRELDFLGFRYIIKNNKTIIKVKNITKRKFKKRIKSNNMSPGAMKCCKKFLSYGDCNKLIFNLTFNK